MGLCGETEGLTMSEVTWTVTEASGKSSVVTSSPKLPYQPEIEITSVMKKEKGQLAFAEAFNAMRKRLIELNQMESR
jgi:hypothetical protein